MAEPKKENPPEVQDNTDLQPVADKPTESLSDIINTIADRVEPVLKIITTIAERSLKASETDVRFRVHMAKVAVFVVSIIVIAAGILTYVGKLDGSTFGFLLGLIVGYMLTFIRDSIKRSPED